MKALELAKKLSTPNEVGMVSMGEAGEPVLLKADGDSVTDKTQKEFEALIFKDQHPLAPKKWRSWFSKNSKEF